MAHHLQLSGSEIKVLKISIIEAAGETVTLQLDGKVSGRWVKLLQRVCNARIKKRTRISIDLKNVSFADRDGIALLKSLTDRRVEILNALPFITEQINGSTWGKESEK